MKLHHQALESSTEVDGGRRKIADFVLQNSEQVINLTIEELAAEPQMRYATIVRVCKRLGYSGYKEFKPG